MYCLRKANFLCIIYGDNEHGYIPDYYLFGGFEAGWRLLPVVYVTSNDNMNLGKLNEVTIQSAHIYLLYFQSLIPSLGHVYFTVN
jgi:hypothetical protein